VIERNRSSFQDSLALIFPAFIHGKEPPAFQTRAPYAAPSSDIIPNASSTMGLFADRHLTCSRREKGKRVGLVLFWGHAANFRRSFLIEIEAKRRLAAAIVAACVPLGSSGLGRVGHHSKCGENQRKLGPTSRRVRNGYGSIKGVHDSADDRQP
jgi:hypothetical protein